MNTNQLKRAAMRAAQSGNSAYQTFSFPERVWFKNVSHDNGHCDSADAIVIKLTPSFGEIKIEMSLFDSRYPFRFLYWEEVYEGSLNEVLKYLREQDLPAFTFTALKSGKW